MNIREGPAHLCAPSHYPVRMRVVLTHVDGAREGLGFGEYSETVVKAGNVVFSLHLVGEEGLVALEGHGRVEFVHGESCGA